MTPPDEVMAANEPRLATIDPEVVAGAAAHGEYRRWYLPVRAKFALAFALAFAWMALSIALSLPWLRDLAAAAGWALALFAIGFIAWGRAS
jgi:biofilm PGA synthesis N-glycosyltransferase PgaC